VAMISSLFSSISTTERSSTSRYPNKSVRQRQDITPNLILVISLYGIVGCLCEIKSAQNNTTYLLVRICHLRDTWRSTW